MYVCGVEMNQRPKTTKKMKAENQFKNIEYTIFLTEGTLTSIEKMNANRIFNSGVEEGYDYEFIYSLNDQFEKVIKMNVGDSIPFKSDRNENWTSVIVRIK